MFPEYFQGLVMATMQPGAIFMYSARFSQLFAASQNFVKGSLAVIDMLNNVVFQICFHVDLL